MKYSDLKYEILIRRDSLDLYVATRLASKDDIHSIIEEEMLRLDFLKGDDVIEIRLWNGGDSNG